MTFKALVFMTLGGAFLIAAVIASVSVVRFTAASEIAAGVVTRLNAGGSHPQVAFTTAAGQPASYPQGGLVFGKAVGDGRS